MAQSNFVPNVWAEAVKNHILNSPMTDLFGPTRRGHHLPLTEAQLRQFEDFKLRYNAIVAEGDAKGYLGYEHEGGAYFTTPYGELVWDESEEEFAARRAEWEASHNGPVTFPIINHD